MYTRMSCKLCVGLEMSDNCALTFIVHVHVGVC